MLGLLDAWWQAFRQYVLSDIRSPFWSGKIPQQASAAVSSDRLPGRAQQRRWLKYRKLLCAFPCAFSGALLSALGLEENSMVFTISL